MHELSELKPPVGARRPRRRVGRGIGSGRGKTCGKGHKGLGQRKSPSPGLGFEGGQMPMQRRLPKIGFKNIFAKAFATLNVSALDRFPPGTRVDEAALRAAGLVKGRWDGIKLLGDGEIDRPLTVVVDRITAGANAKITAAGGSVELLGKQEVAGG
jgi:large subunit ribosomal protein L15